MSETETFVDDFSSEEEAATVLMSRPGLTVFVGKKQQRGRSAVMAGSRAVTWHRAINCVGANHAERAAAYVERYRTAHQRQRLPA